MITQSANAMEELSRQVERVATIRAHYQMLDRKLLPRVNPEPAIAMMDAAIEAGHQAAASGDALTIIRAIRELKGFEE